MSNDKAIRAITEDGAFRVITINTTETVREATRIQDVHGDIAALFGELLTGAMLVRETMAPTWRVQLILKDKNNNSMIAESRPKGPMRGLVQLQDRQAPELKLTQGSLLQVLRALPHGKLHQGLVEASSTLGLSGALTDYMMTSEQVTSTIGTTCTFDEDGEVAHAGGFIVQLLPEVTELALIPMIVRLEAWGDFSTLFEESYMVPEAMMRMLLEHMPHTILEEQPAFWECSCSEERILSAMTTLGHEEIESIVQEGGFLDISCDYCKTRYSIGAEQLRTLLSTN